MKYTFRREKHEEYGSYGWLGDMQDVFEPIGGMGVAHDILEHGYHKADNDVQEELMALGATLYVRDHGNWWLTQSFGIAYHHDPYVLNMSGELIAIYYYLCRTGEHSRFYDYLLYNGRTVRLRDTDDDDKLMRAATLMVDNLLEEKCLDDDNQQIFDKNKRHIANNILNCLRVGYRNAVNRYRGNSSEDISYLFSHIQQYADRALGNTDIEDYERDRMDIYVNVSKLTMRGTVYSSYNEQDY